MSSTYSNTVRSQEHNLPGKKRGHPELGYSDEKNTHQLNLDSNLFFAGVKKKKKKKSLSFSVVHDRDSSRVAAKSCRSRRTTFCGGQSWRVWRS